MNRRKAFAAAVVLFLTGACSRQAPERRAAPNIVLIVADDLGWTDTGVYGSRYYETPHIDRLAREGLRFTDAYANSNCAPTRAALLTGRYGPRTGVYTVGSGARGLERFRRLIPPPNNTELPLAEVTYAEALGQAGYVAAHIGKWHLGTGEFSPENQGFAINIGGNDSGSPRGGYFSPFKNPQLPDGPEGQNLTERLGSEAVQFIHRNAERPFFVNLWFHAVHSPIRAKPELAAKYRAKRPDERHWNAEYAAMIETLDSAVGMVLGALDDLALAEHTVVIFYSDNGGVGGYTREGIEANLEVTGNHPLRGGKGMLYEGGVRVPLIVRFPGVVPAGGVSSKPVHCVDFFPTLLEIAGAEPPAERAIDGVSFLSELRSGGSADASRPPIYWHFPGYLEGKREIGAWRTTPAGAIRAGDYKLIEFFETGRVELYDLSRDLGEREDLADSKPDKAAELRDELRAWRERLAAPMPKRRKPM